jgi:hypothetical protein
MLAGGMIQLMFCLAFLQRYWRRCREQDRHAPAASDG